MSTCDVNDSGVNQVGIDFSSLALLQTSIGEDSSSSVKVSAAVSALEGTLPSGDTGGILRLASSLDQAGNPQYGQTGIVFGTTPLAVETGFLTDFAFRFSGASDGFTFLVQRGGLDGWNGGTGANLGAAGFDPALVVEFDMCPLRSQNDGSCGDGTADGSRSVSIATVCTTSTCASPQNVGSPQVHAEASSGIPNFADGQWHMASIHFIPCSDAGCTTLVVQVDGQEIVSTTATAATLFDGLDSGGDALSQAQIDGQAFGYTGFTASTNDPDNADIDIALWTTRVPTFDLTTSTFSRTSDAADLVDPATGATLTATYILQAKDSCGEMLQYSVPESRFDFVLSTPNDNGFITLDPTIDYLGMGRYQFSYVVAEPGSYTITNYTYDGNSLAGFNPSMNQVRANLPEDSDGVPTWAFIVIAIVFVAILASMSYLAYRLHRYRKKYRENKMYINEGRNEDDIEMNQVDEYEALLKKVQAVEAEMAKLKESTAANREALLKEAEEQRAYLRAEVQRLRKEKATRGSGAKSRGSAFTGADIV